MDNSFVLYTLAACLKNIYEEKFYRDVCCYNDGNNDVLFKATLYVEIDDKNTIDILFTKINCWYSVLQVSDAVGAVNEGGAGIIRLGIGLN